MRYNRGKYRHHSIRLKTYDYSQQGAYFVTVCTGNRLCLFGDIDDGKMRLSPIGDIVRKFWLESPKHFHNADLDQFIIMPNHIHGIIVLVGDGIEVKRRGVQLNAPTMNYYSQISPRRNTLSVIARTFKGALTKWCKNNCFEYFRWQRNYYDHIVRNEKELNAIREYIIYNPIKWELDRENPLSKNYNIDFDVYFRGIYEK